MSSITLQESPAVSHVAPQSERISLMAIGSSENVDSKPHDVYADFRYYLDPGDGSLPEPVDVSKPSSYMDKPDDVRTMLVHDIRGSEDQYTLDKHGFQVHCHVSKEKEFLDEDQIKAQYYPEIEQLLKDITGASRVYIWHYTIRREPNNSNGVPYTGTATKKQQGPVRRVHIDQTSYSARNNVRRYLPDEAEDLLAGRYQLINVWRPIRTVYKDPLAIMDAQSYSEDDLVPVKVIYPGHEGETFVVRPRAEEAKEKHKWHYLYGQTPEEVMIFKCYDSKKDGRARRVPHCAFSNPEEVHREPRESIEVRCLVFTPDEGGQRQ